MKSLIRKLISFCWPFLLLGGYLIYRAVAQYSTLPGSFSSLREADRYAWHLKFPWIGLGFVTGTSDQAGEQLQMYAVEYLFRHKDRVFVVAGKDGDFRVIDEFVSGPSIKSVELKQGRLRYLDFYGHLIIERDARSEPNHRAALDAGRMFCYVLGDIGPARVSAGR